VAKDEVPPPKKKQRKLVKGASVAKATRKDTTAAMAIEPVAAPQDKVKAEKEKRRRKTNGNGVEDK
ncbi:hypothetical protein Dimus_026908, partial [Dionaea muscipula]